VSLADLPAHLFALALVTVVPLSSAAALRMLLDGDHLRVPRAALYRDVVASQWILAGVAMAVLLPVANPLTVTGLSAAGRVGLATVLLLLAVAAMVERAGARPSLPLREPGGSLARVAYLLPRTRAERWWWIALSVTAGVCEEIVFRGFLLHYLATHAPQIGMTGAVVLSSIAFGLGHLYQGLRSAALTALVGAALAAAYLVTGSLWTPIVLHALLDLRILWIRLPPEPVHALDDGVAPEVP
jgi:uncharacterized protein